MYLVKLGVAADVI